MRLSRILRKSEIGLSFWCPGCDEVHHINVNPGWTWNDDVERPVFSPSIKVTSVRPLTDEQHAAFMRGEGIPEPVPTCCHSFVGCNGAQPGQIVFLSDCTHKLAGQVVDMVGWPEGYD